MKRGARMHNNELFRREQYLSKIRGFYHDTDIIKVITGVRRCGKSSLMDMIKDELVESGISEDCIIYLDLDSRKYRKIKTDDEFENVVDELSVSKEIKYLFVDEIQNIQNFEKIINAFRNDEDYSIFITGSNSYLLSGELSTKLAGRYVEFELFTLNFNEYLAMKEFYQKGTSFDDYTQEDIFLMMDHINSYKRKKLNNRSPYGAFSFYYGKDILKRLACRPVAAENIILKPRLLKK
jgi:hypothetical protein